LQIKAIVFDLGNVLIPFDYNRFLNKLNNISDGLGTRFYEKYKDNYNIHRQYERWELSDDQFLDIMMDWTEHKVEREEFCKIYSDLFEENKEVSALLPKLKKNYTLVLLSNTNYIHKKYGWEGYEFLKYFDKLVLSYEAGAVKPERKIYETVMSFTKLNPEEHLFIDDVADYVKGAIEVGWNAVQFTGADKLKSDFDKFGIIY